MKEIRFSVYTILIKNGKFLMLLREKPNVWEFPGGGIEFGEHPEKTAKRETYEETGLNVNVKLFTIGSCIYPNKKIQQISIFYLGEPIKFNEIKIKEHLKYKWFSLGEIKELNNLALSVKAILRKLKDLI